MTNALISKIASVREAGESYNNANILKNRKAEIVNFLNPFNELFNKFNEVCTSYDAITKVISSFNVDFTSIQLALFSLKSKIEKDEYEQRNVAAIKRDVERININLKSEWKTYISSRLSPVDGVLDTLGNLISDMPEKQALQNKKYIIYNYSIGNPLAVKAIDDYVVIYNALMDKLNLSDDVLVFLKLLTSGKVVKLSDLNKEVYDWIQSSGFADKINLNI